MKTATLLIIIAFLQFAESAYGCAKHPGMTHEQWTSQVKSEKDKDGNEQSMSKGFFDSKPKTEGSAPVQYEESIGRRRVPSSGENRKIREIQ
jgi:hypothetical protein